MAVGPAQQAKVIGGVAVALLAVGAALLVAWPRDDATNPAVVQPTSRAPEAPKQPEEPNVAAATPTAPRSEAPAPPPSEAPAQLGAATVEDPEPSADDSEPPARTAKDDRSRLLGEMGASVTERSIADFTEQELERMADAGAIEGRVGALLDKMDALEHGPAPRGGRGPEQAAATVEYILATRNVIYLHHEGEMSTKKADALLDKLEAAAAAVRDE